MDKELDKMFEEYEFGTDMDEQEFDRHAAEVREKFESKMEHAGKRLRVAQDLIAMFRYFLDQRVAWQNKAVIVAALAYFILPLDTIPDVVPFIGYLDDFGVIAAVTKFMADQLAPYYPA